MDDLFQGQYERFFYALDYLIRRAGDPKIRDPLKTKRGYFRKNQHRIQDHDFLLKGYVLIYGKHGFCELYTNARDGTISLRNPRSPLSVGIAFSRLAASWAKVQFLSEILIKVRDSNPVNLGEILNARNVNTVWRVTHPWSCGLDEYGQYTSKLESMEADLKLAVMADYKTACILGPFIHIIIDTGPWFVFSRSTPELQKSCIRASC